jgi:hypothetical protein
VDFLAFVLFHFRDISHHTIEHPATFPDRSEVPSDVVSLAFCPDGHQVRLADLDRDGRCEANLAIGQFVDRV